MKRIVTLLGVLLCTSIVQAQPDDTPGMARPVPVGNAAPAQYSTGDKVPGDPNNGIKGLKEVFRLTHIYRDRHGKYPSAPTDVVDDMMANLKEYGFADVNQLAQTFANPDNIYDDIPTVRANPTGYMVYPFPRKRHDGSELGSPKIPGTRDLLSFVSTYVHKNGLLLGPGKVIENPVGFYLVLWDDGQVQKIPYDQVLYTPSREAVTMVFPGQAGVPFDCLTYEEFQRQYSEMTSRDTVPIGAPLSERTTLSVVDNIGYESLVTLSRLLATPRERELVWDALGREEKKLSLEDVQAAAKKLDLKLQQQSLTLDELTKCDTAAIIQLSYSLPFVTIAALDETHAVILDRGVSYIIPRTLLARFYSGQAIVPIAVENGATAQVTDQVRHINLQSTTEVIEQSVTIKNAGTQPLTLQIEQPIPGVTKAELSSETLAPGAEATLSLTMKWRPMLKGGTQRVFVFLKTNDPLRPRVQLGFQLQSPQTQMP